jgi:hypothetical protein
MENSQNIPPSLLIFIFISLVLCIWSVVDIFRSRFTKLNKVIWLLVVLFAPFGIFIYIFIGRRLKPVVKPEATGERPGPAVSPETGPPAPSRDQGARVPLYGVLIVVAVLAIVTYLNVVSFMGREKTSLVLICAMILVAVILTVLQIRQGRKGR